MILSLRKSARWILAVFLATALVWLLWPCHVFRQPYSTVLYAADGTLLGARTAPDGQWRFPPRAAVPDKFAEAVVRFEDHRFYLHPGVDPLAMGRAIFRNLQAGRVVSGGSTLSMQVVRLSRPEAPRTVAEKLKECLLALRLEVHYSKREILALYASHAPFGGNVVGIDAAAWRYFGRDADHLSWAESAMLAVLPNAPSLVHPSKNREQLQQKRDRLLERLYEAGTISGETLRTALAEPLPDRPADMPAAAPHLLERMAAVRPGESVYSAVDAALQEGLQELAVRYAAREAANHVHNLCMLVLDVHSQDVLAYVGNVPSLPEAFSPHVDIVRAPRSSGSLLKPLLYAAMLEEGTLTPDMLVPDIPFYHDGFSPQNFNKTFDGAVPAHRVLERSLNVPSARMLQQYGYERFHSLLRKLGLTTLGFPASHYGLALILGGAECTLWDITHVYARMADRLNRYSLAAADTSSYPFSAGAVYLTLSSLAQLNRPEEEADWERFASSRRVAWKTGTSFGNRDAWAVGVTPDYAVGVWVGNASGEGRPDMTGIHDAAPLLFDAFRRLPATGWFREPWEDMAEVAVCPESGYAASPLCPHPAVQMLPRGGVRVPACPFHVEVTLNRDASYRVNTSVVPAGDIRREVWFVLPPAEAWYYRQRHSDYRPLPPVHPGAVPSVPDQPLSVIYPQEGSTVVLPLQGDGRPGELVVRAVHSQPSAVLYYHLNGRYLGCTSGEHRLAVAAPPGDYTLSVVDEQGYALTRRFSVR